MRGWPHQSVDRADIGMFHLALRTSRWRRMWSLDPADFHQWDRRLDLLFEGSIQIGALEAIERYLSIDPHCYDPVAAADLLGWAEQHGLIEAIEGNGGLQWHRIQLGVTFIPRLTRSVDIRLAAALLDGQSIEALVSQEESVRNLRRMARRDTLVRRIRHQRSALRAAARPAGAACDREGISSNQTRGLPDAEYACLPLYRLIQTESTLASGSCSSSRAPSWLQLPRLLVRINLERHPSSAAPHQRASNNHA